MAEGGIATEESPGDNDNVCKREKKERRAQFQIGGRGTSAARKKGKNGATQRAPSKRKTI